MVFPFKEDHYQKLGLKLHQARVRWIVPAEKAIELDRATRVTYDRLLIATGAQAVALKIPGADLEGVYKLDHLGDARAILSNARRGRTSLVTGGGITALNWPREWYRGALRSTTLCAVSVTGRT